MSDEPKEDPRSFSENQRKQLRALRHMMIATTDLPNEDRQDIAEKFSLVTEDELRMICARAGIAYEFGGIGSRVIMSMSSKDPEDETEVAPVVIGFVVAGHYSKQDVANLTRFVEGFMQDGTPPGTKAIRAESSGKVDMSIAEPEKEDDDD